MSMDKLALLALTDFFRYTFRLRAENDFGLSEASEESTPFDVSGLAVVER